MPIPVIGVPIMGALPLNLEKIFNTDEFSKETVEKSEIRPDGKEICNKLKEKRAELARLNNINYTSEPCASKEPCAGTCSKCDAEAGYIDRELSKIPKDKIKYPDMKID